MKDYEISKDIKAMQLNYKNMYYNKFFELFLSKYQAKEDITPVELEYILRRYWFDGYVASFMALNNKALDTIIYSKYAVQEYGLYDRPIIINVINDRNIRGVYPSHPLKVNKNCVISYASKSHRPIREKFDLIVDRMAFVEVLINNNLSLQNMPFLMPVDSKNVNKVKRIVNKIINGEIQVFTDEDLTNIVNVLQTGAPYLVKDLKNYLVQLENDAMTLLGLNNNPIEKAERLVKDEVNANNEVIAIFDKVFDNNLNEFIEATNKLFDRHIRIENIFDSLDAKPLDQKEKDGENNDKQSE